MLNKKMFSVLGSMAVMALITAGLGASRGVSQKALSAEEASSSRLEGTWRVKVTPPQGPFAPPPFFAYNTYNRGGTEINSADFGGNYPGQGVWKKIGPHQFISTFEQFEPKDPSDPTQGFIVQKVVETITLTGDSYTGSSIVFACMNPDTMTDAISISVQSCVRRGNPNNPQPTITEGIRLKIDTDQSGDN